MTQGTNPVFKGSLLILVSCNEWKAKKSWYPIDLIFQYWFLCSFWTGWALLCSGSVSLFFWRHKASKNSHSHLNSGSSVLVLWKLLVLDSWQLLNWKEWERSLLQLNLYPQILKFGFCPHTFLYEDVHHQVKTLVKLGFWKWYFYWGMLIAFLSSRVNSETAFKTLILVGCWFLFTAERVKAVPKP